MIKVQEAHNIEKVSRESQETLGGPRYLRSEPGQRVEPISRDVRVLVVSGGGSEEILSKYSRSGRSDQPG